jgi:protein-disulfide isomerase
MRAARLVLALCALAGLSACEEKASPAKPDPARSSGPTPSASATSSAAPPLVLEGVDVSMLNGAREQELWASVVGEVMSPCKEVATPLKQCVAEKRNCKACKPAVELTARLVHGGVPKQDILDVLAARFGESNVKAIVIGDSPTRGPSDAPVTVIEFADFECGGCGDAYPLLEEAYNQFRGNVRFVYKNFPWPAHPNAHLAARAGWAALQQHKFWELHHLMFTNQERLTEPDLLEYAKTTKVDMAVFKKDLASPMAKQRVDEERKQGEELGVVATPSIFINGRLCDLTKLGPEVDAELKRWIQTEIDLAASGSAPAKASASPSPSASPSAAPSAAPSASAKPR